MDQFYSKEILKHFKNPQNVGRMRNPSGCGKVGNIICGDTLWLYIKVGKNKKREEVIKKASFETFGCVVAVANSSLLATIIKGKTLEEAMKIRKEDLLKRLGEVPISKMHCSALAIDALREAIYDYLRKKKRVIPERLERTHQRIEKEKKEIEKRYKEWIKQEEKMLKK